MVTRCAVCVLIVLAGLVSGATKKFKGYNFESYAIGDNFGQYQEIWKNNSPFIQVGRDEEYSIIINNPLPVRVAVAVTIDGLNVIDGKRSSTDKAQKWMIDPNASITLRGWQTDRSSLRRFVFTDKSGSYAQWKGNHDKKTYTQNLGVIGVAFFWSSSELQAALHPPKPFHDKMYGKKFRSSDRNEAPAPASKPQMSKSEEVTDEKAGTGMGSRENNSVVDVEFHYDIGMYNVKDVLVIYYEFARNTPKPSPFS
ncbi:MAG: hypothetical protein ACM31E_05845, partial [Fibrobacterota bacterium]|nr:hypothetical protein [Chitinispirillaceae bacterium]